VALSIVAFFGGICTTGAPRDGRRCRVLPQNIINFNKFNSEYFGKKSLKKVLVVC
jgi:hypothetical protein